MSRAVELAKECGAVLIDGVNDYGNYEVFAELWLTQLESFYHAARAGILMEAAKSIESVDPFSFAIELLRDKAKMEENQ